MVKWDVRFTEADARKVAEKLFPDDVFVEPCGPNCLICPAQKKEWEAQVNKVWEALKVLEGWN